VVSALLGATRRLVVATGIVNIWTNPAAMTAANYTKVAAAHPERVLLGLGVGHASFVERATGQRYARPYEKLTDYLDELDAIIPPVPKARRVLAALGPRMLALARGRAAGAHPYLVNPDHTRQAREILGQGPLLAPEQKVVLEADPAKARAIARESVGLYLRLPNYTNNLLRIGYTADDFADGGSNRLIDGLVAWGDTDTVLARVSEHHQAGADHVCIQVLTEDKTLPRAQWRTLATALHG
jgi:probable F420-dependent oxidoreductase